MTFSWCINLLVAGTLYIGAAIADNDNLPPCKGPLEEKFFNVDIHVDELPGSCDDENNLYEIGELIKLVVEEVELTMPEFKKEYIETDVCPTPESVVRRLLRTDQSHRRLGRYSYRGGGICRRCKTDNVDRRQLQSSNESTSRKLVDMKKLLEEKEDLEKDLKEIKKKITKQEEKKTSASSDDDIKKIDKKIAKLKVELNEVIEALELTNELMALELQAKQTPAPVTPTPAPVSPTPAPVMPTPRPVVPTPAPVRPTASPTKSPTASPTVPPTTSPTPAPTKTPAAPPTASPTVSPTKSPTANPTVPPTTSPTPAPTKTPAAPPTASPTVSPTKLLTANPTGSPTASGTDLSREEIQDILKEFAEQLEQKESEVNEKMKIAELLSQGLGRSAGGPPQGTQGAVESTKKELMRVEAASEELSSFQALAGKQKPTPQEKKELLKYSLQARNGVIAGAANWDLAAEVDDSMEQWFRNFGDKLIKEIPARLVAEYSTSSGGCVDGEPYLVVIITELNSFVGQYSSDECVVPAAVPPTASLPAPASSLSISSPTAAPTTPPTKTPTRSPTKSPTTPPTKAPTRSPTEAPTSSPTNRPTVSPSRLPIYLEIPIANNIDDAEEYRTDTASHYAGEVTRTSSDLELAREHSSGNARWLYVGLRFRSVGVPAGATILDASIEFTKDNQESGRQDGTTRQVDLTIAGQLTGDAPEFTTSKRNISDRVKNTSTPSTVAWNIPASERWNSPGTVDSPDIKSIVQDIVDQDRWNAGQSMVLIIYGDLYATGTRVAHARDAGASLAPKLKVTYTTAG